MVDVGAGGQVAQTGDAVGVREVGETDGVTGDVDAQGAADGVSGSVRALRAVWPGKHRYGRQWGAHDVAAPYEVQALRLGGWSGLSPQKRKEVNQLPLGQVPVRISR